MLAFARFAQEAGLPDGALNVITGPAREAGAALSAHPGVKPRLLHRPVATGADARRGGGENAVPVTLELAASRRRSCSPTPTST